MLKKIREESLEPNRKEKNKTLNANIDSNIQTK